MTSDITKYIALVLTAVGMLVLATWLVSSAHADIKSWTLDQDSVRTEKVLEIVDRYYVSKEDFVRIETKLEAMEKLLDKIDKKL